MVHPDPQRAGAGLLAIVVVAGVADYNADVVFCPKGQCLGDMLGLGHVDGIDYVIAQCTWLRDRVVRVAGTIREEWSHN